MIWNDLFLNPDRLNKEFHLTLYDGCNYLPMLGFKFTYVSKRHIKSMQLYLVDFD